MRAAVLGAGSRGTAPAILLRGRGADVKLRPRSAAATAGRFGIEAPITEEMNRVLFFGKSPMEAIDDLMTRDPKAEDWVTSEVSGE